MIFSPDIRNVDALLALSTDNEEASLLFNIEHRRRKGAWGAWVIAESSEADNGHKYVLRNHVFSVGITLEHVSYFINVYCVSLRDLTDDELRRLLKELFYNPQLASKSIDLEPLQGVTKLRMPRLELRADKYTKYPMEARNAAS